MQTAIHVIFSDQTDALCESKIISNLILSEEL